MKISMKPGKFFRKLWTRYSAPAVFCVMIAIIATVHDFLGWDAAAQAARDTLMDVSSALAIGLVISTAAATLFKQGKPAAVLSWLAGLAAAALEYLLPNPDLYGSIALAALCLCIGAAAGREKPALRLNQICGWFFLCLGLSIVIWLALTLIQSAILSLFFPSASSTIRTGITSLVAYFSFLLLAPWMFLGGLPDDATPADKRLGFQKFNARVLLPLALLLMAVLLAYVGKIVIAWTMPVGTMNGYALAALALFTFFHLTLTGEENRIAAFFCKWGGWLMLPVLAAQQVGVWIRVSAYGLTEARVYGIVCTVLCGAVVVASLLRRRAGWFFPVAALAAIIFIGTPLNAGNLARINQETRLEAALQRNDMLTEDGAILPNPDANMDDRTIIYDSIRYLLNQDAPEGSLTAWVNDYFSQDDSTPNSWVYAGTGEIYELLGFTYPSTNTSSYFTIGFSGSAEHDDLDVRGVAHASWIHVSSDYESAEAFSAAFATNSDIAQDYFIYSSAAIRDYAQSASNGEPLPALSITLVLNGEEIPLAPLLSATETTTPYAMSSRTFSLENDKILLSSGTILHISNLSIHSYSNDYVSVSLTGWLLTPEAE